MKNNLVVDRYTTLKKLGINHPIRDYLLESISGYEEEIPDQIFYTSSLNFWKISIFPMSIISLQNLPILNIAILLGFEIILLISNLALIISLKSIKNRVFTGFRIASNLSIFPFLGYYLTINIFGFSVSNGYLAYIMMFFISAIIFFETAFLIVVHIDMIIFIFQSIWKKKNKYPAKLYGIEWRDEFSNQIIYYRALKMDNTKPVKEKRFESLRKKMILKNNTSGSNKMNKVHVKLPSKNVERPNKNNIKAANKFDSTKIMMSSLKHPKRIQFMSARKMVVSSKTKKVKGDNELEIQGGEGN